MHALARSDLAHDTAYAYYFSNDVAAPARTVRFVTWMTFSTLLFTRLAYRVHEAGSQVSWLVDDMLSTVFVLIGIALGIDATATASDGLPSATSTVHSLDELARSKGKLFVARKSAIGFSKALMPQILWLCYP
jgi:hypothetical protein